MALRTKRSRIRQALGLSVSVFALALVGWGIFINQSEAAAPFPEGNADASVCAYNRNTVRYVAGIQTPHMPDANYDWVHCGSTGQAVGGGGFNQIPGFGQNYEPGVPSQIFGDTQTRRIWLPDNTESVELFSTGGQYVDIYTLRILDFNTQEVLFERDFNLTTAVQTLNQQEVILTEENTPNLGSRVLNIQHITKQVSSSYLPGASIVLRSHFNIKKRTAAINQLPIANDDTATTTENTAVNINLTANDTDPDGNLDPTTATTTAFPSNGTLNGSGNGTVTYTPNVGFTGTDTLTYQVCDTEGACATATATITVNPASNPITEFNITATTICSNNQSMVRVAAETPNPVNGATSYRLVTDGTPGSFATTAEFTELLPENTFTNFQIQALRLQSPPGDPADEQIGISNTVSATGRSDCTPDPGPPVTTLTITPTAICSSGQQTNVFSWNPASAATSVELLRDGQVIATNSAGSVTVSDTNPVNGQSYSYQIRSTLNSAITSNTITVATDQCEPPAPVTITPGDFTLSLSGSTCQDTTAQVELSWTASENADHYQITRKVQGDDYLTFANNVTGTSYIDTTVNSLESYEYRIIAQARQLDGSLVDKASNVLSVTTEDCNPAQLPNLEIEVTPREGIAPMTVTATRLSQHVQGQLCTWNFGDGNTLPSTANSVTHVYNTPGEYSVTLTCGEQNTSQGVKVLANAEVILALKKDVFSVGEQVDFSLLNNGPSNVQLPNPAPFTIKQADSEVFTPVVAQTTEDLLANSQKNLFWTQANNNNQQVDPGNYVVETHHLINNELITLSASFRIVDDNTEIEPASFNVDPIEGNAPLKITGTYSGPEIPNEEIIWDFGDGKTDFGKTVMHTYQNPGVYTVKLNAGNFSGTQEVFVRGEIGTPSSINNVETPISTLASTGGSLLVALAIAFAISGILSYFIVRRPFTKDENN
ncbi:PKD domain-containing protein [Candidatus Berkelbacteria bacterium]|nr:PKD domain-containing protein [Candidatus Berkelbacteria bacterium]